MKLRYNKTIMFFAASSFLVVILSGCISGKAPATKFYILNPMDSDQPLAKISTKNKPLSIKIISQRLPQYLKRPQIVTRSGEHQLELAEYDQWAGNLGKNMNQVLSRNLSQLLATADVSIPPFYNQTQCDFDIEINILEFEKHADNHVHFSARWRLFKNNEKKPIAAEVTDLVSSKPIIGNRFDNTISEMSKLYEQFGRVIAREISNHVNK